MTRPTPVYQPEEVADPTRVASRGLTIVALGVAVAVLILAGLYFGTALFRRDATGSAEVAAAPPATPAAVPQPTPAAVPTEGQVTVTATDEVWVRLYDADGKTLHQGTLKAGESFDVPPGANGPMMNVGRPDHLRFTINGSAVAGLDFGRDPVKDVRISAAALAARVAPPAPGATPTPSATPAPTPSSRVEERPREERRRTDRRPPSRERAATSTPALSETQRANIEAARPPAATGNTQ